MLRTLKNGRARMGALVALIVVVLAAVLAGVPASASTQSSPPGPDPNSPVTREQIAEGQARGAAWDAKRAAAATPQQKAASRTAYADQSSDATFATAESAFPGWLTAPVYTGVPLAKGMHLDRYVGESAAKLSGPNGHGAALISTLPLIGQTPAGAKAPVDLRLQAVGGGFSPRSSAMPVVLPDNATGVVSLPQLGFGVRLVGAVDEAAQLAHDRLWFANVYGQAASTDALIAAERTGTEISYLIRGAVAPEDQRLKFDLPAGARLSLSGAQGQESVTITASDGTTLGVVLPPAAKDATGTPVPSRYSLDGPDQLVMHVAHREGSYLYPVLADPLVASWNPGMYGAWSWSSNASPTLSGIADGSYTATQGPSVGGSGGAGQYGEWRYGSLAGAYIYEEYSSNIWHYPNNTQEFGSIEGSYCGQLGTYGGGCGEAGSWKDTVPGYGSGPGGAGAGAYAARYQSGQESYVDTDYCAQGNATTCYPPAHGTVGAPNVAVTAGLYMTGATGYPGYVPEAAVYADYLYESDDIVPSLSAPTHTPNQVGQWVHTYNEAVGETGSVTTGLGMDGITINSNTGGGYWYYPYHSSYPTPFTQNATLYPSIGDGAATLTAQAFDIGGNGSATQTWYACQDSRKALVSETGTLWNSPGDIILPGTNTLNVNATDGIADGIPGDQQSGVSGITTTIVNDATHQTTYSSPTGSSGGASVPGCGLADTSANQANTVDTTSWVPGRYTLTVSVPDRAGNVKTDTKTLNLVGESNLVGTAQDIVNGVVNAPPAGQYSNTCNSPGATIADGYAGSNTYVTLRAQPNPGNSAQEWVCYRISNPNAGSVGGRVTVSGAGASFGVPSVDSTSTACRDNAASNQVPPPHPLVNGSLLSQTFMVDSYSAANTAWVCLTAGSVNDRVVVPVPGVSGAPSVYNQLDATPPPLPSPPVDPYPSGSCQNGGGSQLMNTNVGGVQTWAYSWQPNGNTADVCARVAGAVSAGGVLSVSTAGSSGITPVLQTGTNPAPCTFSIFTIATPPQAASSLSTTPAGANPATVCVGTGSAMNTYTIGTSGSATPPTVTWTPDPGTP